MPVPATAISRPLESSTEPLALSYQVSCLQAVCWCGVQDRGQPWAHRVSALTWALLCATHTYTCAHGCMQALLLQTDPSTGRVNLCCQSKTSLPAQHMQCSPSCAVTGCGYELLTSCGSQQWWFWHTRRSRAAGVEGTP